MAAKDPLNPTLEEAAKEIATLVKDFEDNENYFLSSDYHEAHVRKDFIDKFLFALGWDVNHNIQKNPFQQEAKVERSVQMPTAQRRADYSLAITPNFESPVLYVEAKQTTPELATADNNFQVIRYANQRSHPIGVLTDFQNLHIVDCRFKANIGTASHRTLRKFHFQDYVDPEKFAWIFYLLARPAVASGSIQKYAATLPKPTGRPGQKAFVPLAYKPIDEQLLETLDDLRRMLAKNLKRLNSELDSAALTELTQRILDRLVFIRFLEDKLIEPDPIIPTLGETSDRTAWQDFIDVCRRLDKTYNGIVFRHHALLDSEDAVRVDEGVFADVLDAFDFYQSDYLFNDIPLHILGSIYERFLGNVIVATEKQADLKLKPELRKRRGVYYTPKDIVDYIVKSTVGKLIEGKSPAQIAKMRFADIACGSGSFLLGVYGLLIRHITEWYNSNPRSARKGATIKRNNGLYLSLAEKARILTDNIYGVDIDNQAVEVASLSLYLKLLEEETTASARQYTLDFHRPLLPSLSDNIKNGNSLIASDFYANKQLELIPTEARRDVNAFDWPSEFKAIVDNGGFDVVLGNPPWVLVQAMNNKEVFSYLSAHYAAAKYKIDTYAIFLERAIGLTREPGMTSYITPNTFLRNKHAVDLRRIILSRTNIKILRLFFYPVFQKVSADVAITIMQRTDRPDKKNFVSIVRSTAPNLTTAGPAVPQSAWANHPKKEFLTDVNPAADALLTKLERRSIPLGSFATAYFGIQTYDRKKYVATRAIYRTYKPVVDGEHIGRYSLQAGNEFVRFERNAIKSGGNPHVYLQTRIGVRQIGRVPIATLLPPKLYTLNTIYNIYFNKPTSYDIHFVLGIVASRLNQWHWLTRFFDQKRTFPKIKKPDLLSIRIPEIDFSKPSEKARHDAIVKLVLSLLALRMQLGSARTDQAKMMLQRQIDAIDNQIDQSLYALYSLTSTEIKLIETTTS